MPVRKRTKAQQLAEVRRHYRKRRAGLCQRCPRKRGASPSAWLCRVCLLKNRVAMRKLRGLKRWRPGSPGRRPLTRETT